MKLQDFLEKHARDLNVLEKAFIVNVFHKDYGDNGLDLIEPQVKFEREDGSGSHYKVDFIIKTNLKTYAIETHGLNFHAQDKVTKERFDHLTRKANFIRNIVDDFIELSREQIMTNPSEAIYELRKYFKADRELFNLYLGRGTGEIKPSKPQQEALSALEHSRAGGHRAGLVSMATGLGKTFLSGLDVIKFKANRVLFIANVMEILRKSQNDFEDLMTDRVSDIGTEDSNPIRFASIQLMHKKERLEKLKKEHYDYIIIDEAHHAAAITYQKLIDYFSPQFLLGLTATPFRKDEKEILPLFGNNLVYEMDQEPAVNEGYLANIKYKGFYDDIDYSDIRWNGKSYDLDDLNKLLMIKPRDEAIIKKYNELSSGKKTIGFCTSIDHAEYMAKLFNRNGIKSIAIHSRVESSKSLLSVDERNDLLTDFRENKYTVAFTVNMFNEGVDFPDTETVLMLRPTESLTIFIQQIGRGLRISHGKEYLLVLDFIGNYRNCDLALEGLNLMPGDLEKGKKKDVYFYNNKGYDVEFDEKVVEIFKTIASKRSKDIDYSKISTIWQDYGDFIKQSTKTDADRKNSNNHFWTVDKKKRNLDQHIWALKFIRDNQDKYPSSKLMDEKLKQEAERLKQPFEGIRALFFSKLLGFRKKDWNSTTEVFDKIAGTKNREEKEQIINNQMEKLFFWNDIYSRLNRHANSVLVHKEDIFSIYPIFYIYQIVTALHNIGEETYLTKNELQYFVFFSRSHDELLATVERVVEYRNYSERPELEKFLKRMVTSDEKNQRFQIFDTRYFEILKFLKHFKFAPERVTLKNSDKDLVFNKSQKFADLIREKNIFPRKNIEGVFEYDDYKKMLYSNSSLLEFYS